MRPALWTPIVAVACGAPAAEHEPSGDADTPSGGDFESTGTWRVRVVGSATLLRPDAQGCLRAAEALSDGAVLEALAADDARFLVGEDGACVAQSEVVELERPALLPAGRPGLVQVTTRRAVYGSDGCPIEVSDLAEASEVEALARSYDANYRGWVVIGRDLSLAPVRHIDSAEWLYPWHAGVQLVKHLDTGQFVIAAGVVIGPRAIATAAHNTVDATWCYSREARSGPAWDAGLFECSNIAGPAITDPDGVDAAVVELIDPIGPPYAELRSTAVPPGAEFYTSQWGSMRRANLADATVGEIGAFNARCETWPAASSFDSGDLVSAAGDSGGPAWIGDELVGLVHGERCKVYPWDATRHVWVHLPSLSNFLLPYTE